MTVRSLFAFLLLLGIAGCEPETDPTPEPSHVEAPASMDTVTTPAPLPTAPEPVAEATPEPEPVLEDTASTGPAPDPLPTTEAPDATGDVRGVIYGTDGEPVMMANVVDSEARLGAATDFDGAYVVRGLPVGLRTLTITHSSGETATVEVEIVAGDVQDLNVTLEQPE